MTLFWFAFLVANVLEITECCSYGEVRLSEQAQSQYGMLQICNSAQTWEAVCDYGWSCTAAGVACRQLGYTNSYAEFSTHFGAWDSIGFGPYYCSSSDDTLFDCYEDSYYQNSYYCNPNRDTVGLICNNNSDSCTTGNVKLVGGNTASEGRVEYCYNGRWSALCTSSYTMSQITASRICSQLGYTQPNYAAIFTDGRFGTNINKPHVTYISCSRDHFNVRECRVYTTGCLIDCTYQYGIKCYDHEGCNEGSVRLVNGTVEKEGRLEICNNGIWGGICSYGFSESDGYVACKQMGYNNGAIVYDNSEYSDGDGPIVYSNVSCYGDEDGLYDCEKDGYDDISSCPRTRLIGLLCRDDCESGDIRLVGGDNEGEGTVEICYDHIWGLISDAGWNDSDAEVVCTQLGYQIEIESEDHEAISGSFYGKPNKAIHYDSVNCDGSERVLTNCLYVQYSLEYGKELNIHVEVAGVKCQGKLQYVFSTVISTTTASQVALFSIGIIALIFGVTALIIGITLIGVFIWKLRQKSNNNYLNKETLSKSSIAKQSFQSTPPHTRQLSKKDDRIKMDTLPPLPQKQQPNAPPDPSHQNKNEDYEDVLNIDEDYDDVLYLKEETLSKSPIAKQSFQSTPPHTRQLSKKDDTIKTDTLSPLPQKQQPNAPPVPSHEDIDEVYDDVLYI